MSDGIITTDILRRDERGAVAAVTVDRTAKLNVVNGAMCRDLAVAFDGLASDACMGMPEVQVGVPSVIEAALLPELIGWGRTRRLVFTGELIDAAKALAWGLVEEVIEPDALDQAMDDACDAIVAAGPAATNCRTTTSCVAGNKKGATFSSPF